MFTAVTRPIMLALSAASGQHKAPAPAATPPPQNPAQAAQQAETITCPLTGEPIPSCCCPVKK
jgi:hypothetical protein